MVELGGSGSPEFKLMIEGFLEYAKQQNDDLVEGALFIFIPDGGDASNMSILSWVPVDRGKDIGNVWQEAFIALVWTLMSAGITPIDIHRQVNYAADIHSSVDVEQQDVGEDDSVEN
jgi:hypothetical protein